MKKTLNIILFVTLLCLNVASMALLVKKLTNAKPTSAETHSTSVVISIKELGSKIAIDRATICIVETREYLTTDQNGTVTATVPVIKNSNYENSLAQNWGEITILVYKSGYADHIYMHAAVNPKTKRLGLIIYLSPIINSTDATLTLTVEEPNRSWAEALVELYKK